MHAAPGQVGHVVALRLAHEHDVAGRQPRRVLRERRPTGAPRPRRSRGPRRGARPGSGRPSRRGPWCARRPRRGRAIAAADPSEHPWRRTIAYGSGAIQAWILPSMRAVLDLNRIKETADEGRAIRSLRRRRRPGRRRRRSARRRRGPGRGARRGDRHQPRRGRDPRRARCTSAGRRPSRPARAATSRAWSTEVGAGVDGVSVGDEVIGYTDERASHAELVAVDAEHLTPRPAAVPWEVAGSLYVVGATAYAAVRAVAPARRRRRRRLGRRRRRRDPRRAARARRGGDRRRAGERGPPRLAARARSDPGDLRRRRRRAHPRGRGRPVDAFIDLFGSGYVELAIELGVAPERIDTIADPTAPERHPGVKVDGNMAGASPETLAELAALIAEGALGGPDRPRLPARRGARGLHRARAPPHARQDRAAAVI